jgi:hypothetical protein
VVWAVAAADTTEISRLSRSCFDRAARENLHLALIELPIRLVERYWKAVRLSDKTVTCLRSCLMKPEHDAWIDEIWSILDKIN